MSIRNKAFLIHLSASAIALALLTIWLLAVWYAPWPLLGKFKRQQSPIIFLIGDRDAEVQRYEK